MSRFIRCDLIRISREHNSQADALAKLASTSDMKLSRTITVFRLPSSNLSEDHQIGVLIPDPKVFHSCILNRKTPKGAQKSPPPWEHRKTPKGAQKSPPPWEHRKTPKGAQKFPPPREYRKLRKERNFPLNVTDT
ncbi:hypothetical protein LWI29_003459 [Acer saccharum]|uniref:Uncharacterized protein n=1 Tax=Acer saccharum TaxID=4024 RepID=A0AA39V6A2_ACESA|nr:hypothetical protein LWI29_003459 [Acer saccharum]